MGEIVGEMVRFWNENESDEFELSGLWWLRVMCPLKGMECTVPRETIGKREAT